MDNESKLVGRILDDDLIAFELLYNRYKKKIYCFSLKYLKNKVEAEDLVQDVFINLWEHRKSLNETQPVRSYIYRSVVNQIYNREHKLKNKSPFNSESFF